MTELVVVRHGVTDWNREKRLQGHTDIALNPEGRKQAACLASALQYETFDVLYSSDLSRAIETAQAVADQQRGQRILAKRELRERHYGVFEGVPHHELAQRFPQSYAAWKARDALAALPGGESLHDFYGRITTYLTFLAQQHPGQRIFVATHGGVLDCIYRLCTGTPLSAPRMWELPNSGINRLRYDQEKFQLIVWADTQHLRRHGAVLETEHL
jgi:probable phosphoglycerate mutase